MAKEQWVNIQAVQKHLGISKSTMYKKGIDDLLPFTMIGSVRKYKLSEIDAWLAKNPKALVVRGYAPKTKTKVTSKPEPVVDTRPQVRADTLAAAISAVDKLLAELRTENPVLALRPATKRPVGRPRKVVS
jgi:predicted DNA-binding transcriptional regulator AlpA